jgi:hypothetical protein
LKWPPSFLSDPLPCLAAPCQALHGLAAPCLASPRLSGGKLLPGILVSPAVESIAERKSASIAAARLQWRFELVWR